MTLILAIKNKNKITWFLFPIICFLSFLSMQTPSAYILLILFFILSYYFIKERDFKNLKFFLLGSTFSILAFSIFLLLTKTPFINFLYQYILFPVTIGSGRIVGSETAYLNFADQLNFKRLFGEFKFIHFLLFPLIFFAFKNFKKNEVIMNILNLSIIASTIAFIFSQLITANQIYIFSLIPFIAALLHLNLIQLNINSKMIFLFTFLVFFATIKFHIRYNIERKFHDLEYIDKDLAVSAKNIHKNLNSLKWITRFDKPKNEVEFLRKAINIIDEDEREKTLITHYQFISTVLDKNLNIINRWYLWDNNTHPTENHKYFDIYKSLVNRNINSNNIKVIYLLGQGNEDITFNNIKNYFTDLCFESKTLVEKRFSVHEIKKCKK